MLPAYPFIRLRHTVRPVCVLHRELHMDAHLFRRFAAELLPVLQGARLVKIQQPHENIYTFNLDLFARNNPLGRKVQLVLRPGRKEPYLFLSQARIAAGTEPSAMVMRLRKYAAGHTIRRAIALWQKRELHLLLSGAMPGMEKADAGEEQSATVVEKRGQQSPEKMTWLVLSLRDGPALHFAEEGFEPSEEAPVWPDHKSLEGAMADWRSWSVLTPALRRTLAKLDPQDACALLVDLEEGGGDVFCYTAPDDLRAGEPRIVQISAWPLPYDLQKGQESCRTDVFNAVMETGASLVLNEAADKRAHEAAAPWRKKERRIEDLLKRNTEDCARLKEMCQKQEYGLLIQASLWQLEGSRHLSSLTLPDFEGGQCTMQLAPRFSVRENMDRFFHTARRGERGLPRIEKRRQELEEELAEVRREKERCLLGISAQAPRQKKGQAKPAPVKAPASVQIFVSSDGVTLLRGRNAKGNLEVRRMAASHDIWVHVEGGAGAHVIIRLNHASQKIPDRTLDEAGSLAASKSSLKDESYAKVNYCEIRHVRQLKGTARGTMRMDKILFTRKVAIRPELETSLLPKDQAKDDTDSKKAR